MPDPSFVGYVGEPDFHDASIMSVEHREGSVSVRLRGSSGKVFIARFSGVREVKASKPEGMILYALSEMNGQPPLRRFVFANWDERSNAHLEIEAADLSVSTE